MRALHGPPPHLLIADDQPHVVEALRLLLKPESYRMDTADSPEAVIRMMSEASYDAVLLDLNYARDTTSGQEGLDLLARIRQRDSTTPLVVMTAWATVRVAVEAMQRGAGDFVEKPWDNDRLSSVLRAQVGLGRALRRSAQLEAMLRQDLVLAARLQQQLLPQTAPVRATLDCHGMCVPARGVGGDFYDFFPVDGKRVGLAVGDIAGKGVSAALLMAGLQALLRSRATDRGTDVAALVGEINRLFEQSSPAERFATLFYAVYDDETRRLTYVNAGHNPPLLVRAGGTVERLEVGGGIIGMFPSMVYAQRTLSLEVGDTLIVFTDGLTDARTETGEEFGDARLCDTARACIGARARTTCAAISDAVAAFAGEAIQHDDQTLIVARVL